MLITCPECGKEVSDIAKTCPNCGFPIYKIENETMQEEKTDKNHYARPTQQLTKSDYKKNNNKTWIWIVIAVIVFILILPSSDEETTQEVINEDVQENVEETVIEETTEEPQTEVAEISKEEYIAQCEEYNYKDVLRNPADYVGQKIKITVKISSVHEASWLYNNKYYFAYSNDEYDMYLGDRYAIIDKRYDNSLKLLDDDIILIYGEIAEPEETKSYIVNSEELFTIDMRYVELLEE